MYSIQSGNNLDILHPGDNHEFISTVYETVKMKISTTSDESQ
jgi:hypothetical protein